jgi:hypothetical protein
MWSPVERKDSLNLFNDYERCQDILNTTFSNVAITMRMATTSYLLQTMSIYYTNSFSPCRY